MSRTAFFGQHFVFEAMARAGRFDPCWQHNDVFRELFERQGLSTFPAIPNSHRSLCHAWSTGPVHSLFAHGLGIHPLRPHWNAILIAPQPGPLKWLSGGVPTPHGDVSVELRRKGSGWCVQAHTPANIPVTVRLPGRADRPFPQGGFLNIETA